MRKLQRKCAVSARIQCLWHPSSKCLEKSVSDSPYPLITSIMIRLSSIQRTITTLLTAVKPLDNKSQKAFVLDSPGTARLNQTNQTSSDITPQISHRLHIISISSRPKHFPSRPLNCGDSQISAASSRCMGKSALGSIHTSADCQPQLQVFQAISATTS